MIAAARKVSGMILVNRTKKPLTSILFFEFFIYVIFFVGPLTFAFKKFILN